MPYETLLYQKERGVGVVTLNRPQRLNAISLHLVDDLNRMVDEVEKDEELRVVVITGAPRPDGRPCFSAGADLKEIATGARGESSVTKIVKGMMDQGLGPHLAGVCDRIQTSGKVFIAAIDGVCTAGGIELALACDIRVASETAQISDLHIKNLGSIGGAGVTTRLARTVGPAWAKEIMFTGEPIGGQEATRIGFANHCFPPDKLLSGAKSLAQKMADKRPEALALAKASMNAAMDLDIGRALRYSYICAAALPAAEGARAFAEKRPPPHTRAVA